MSTTPHQCGDGTISVDESLKIRILPNGRAEAEAIATINRRRLLPGHLRRAVLQDHRTFRIFAIAGR